MWEVEETRTVFVLPRERFPPVPDLPEGYAFAEEIGAEAERRLLEPFFENWQAPVERRMPGSRPDSVVAILHDDEPIALGYMCDDNEYGLPALGEGHYVVVHPDHRGQRIYNCLYAKLLEKADGWGLTGIVMVTDRHGLADVYRRWGGIVIREAPKSAYAGGLWGEPRPARARPSLRDRLGRLLGREA